MVSARVEMDGMRFNLWARPTMGLSQWGRRYAPASGAVLILVNEGSQCHTKSVGQSIDWAPARVTIGFPRFIPRFWHFVGRSLTLNAPVR